MLQTKQQQQQQSGHGSTGSQSTMEEATTGGFLRLAGQSA